jgi:aquaporin Z
MSDTSTALTPEMGQKLIAEFLGTFVLVFFGVGSVVILGAAGGQLSDYTGIALTFGIAVAVMIYAVGRISGGHFNPAVSIGAAIGGRVPWSEALVYMVTQVVGATVGALALFIVAHGYDGFGAKAGWAPTTSGPRRGSAASPGGPRSCSS